MGFSSELCEPTARAIAPSSHAKDPSIKNLRLERSTILQVIALG